MLFITPWFELLIINLSVFSFLTYIHELKIYLYLKILNYHILVLVFRIFSEMLRFAFFTFMSVIHLELRVCVFIE